MRHKSKRRIVVVPLRWDPFLMCNLIGEETFRSKYPVDKYLGALDPGGKLPKMDVCQLT